MKNNFKRNRNLITGTFLLVLAVIPFYTINAATLRAGISKINITKDNPTEVINDSLYAKVLFMDDGKIRAVIITLDVINYTALPELRALLWDNLRIDGQNVIICPSHNHWVRDQLAEDYFQRIIKGVKEASQTMVPVKVGAGSGTENRITMNRRISLKDGKEWTIRRATPEPREEMVAGIAEGFDPEIGVLRVDKLNGNPLAVIYNFAIHPYTGVPNRGVTASTPGFASKVIEENLGNGALAFFINGAAADITPILYKDVNAPKQDEMLGTLLGLSTLSTWRNIQTYKKISLNIVTEKLELPVRTAAENQKHIEYFEERRAKILDYFRGEGCGALGGGTKLNFKSFLPLYIKYKVDEEYPSDYSYRYLQEEKVGITNLEMLDSENRKDLEKYLNSIYKMEELIETEANLGYLRNNGQTEPFEVDITGLRIGDFILITFPGEMFASTGLNIKKASPFPLTFIAGYSNGHIGYAPTPEAYKGNGYEVSLSKLASEWEKIYNEKAMGIIEKL